MDKKNETPKKRTLVEVYESLPKVASPKAEFITRLANATYRSENAVRMWVAGVRVPDQLTQKAIERELGIPAEELFPIKKED